MPVTIKSEKDVKKAVKKLLDAHGWFWWMPAANGYGASGVSDILCLKAGVFIAIETKFDKGQLTAMQRAFLNSINAESGFGFVVNELNLDWLEAFLVNFGDSVREVQENKRMGNEAGATLVDAIRMLQMLI